MVKIHSLILQEV